MEIGVRTNGGVPCFVLKPMKCIICFCSNRRAFEKFTIENRTPKWWKSGVLGGFLTRTILLFLWSINIIDPIKLSRHTIPILRFCRRSVLPLRFYGWQFHVFFHYFSNEGGGLLSGGLFPKVGFPSWPPTYVRVWVLVSSVLGSTWLCQTCFNRRHQLQKAKLCHCNHLCSSLAVFLSRLYEAYIRRITSSKNRLPSSSDSFIVYFSIRGDGTNQSYLSRYLISFIHHGIHIYSHFINFVQ